MSKLVQRKGLGWVVLAVSLVSVAACGSDPGSMFGNNANGANGGSGAGPNGSFGSGGTMNCGATSPDEQGCQCTPGQTHACYTGPASTRNTAPCHDGTQSCVSNGEFNLFGPCTGDTVPTAQNTCTSSNGGPPGGGGGPDASTPTQCSPPQVFNGQQRCPQGTLLGKDGLCCPCQASDCGTNQSCCAAAVCAGAANCSSCQGMPLDPVCNGFVDKDCDGFPEDCDQLCCPCKPSGSCQVCPSGSVPCNGVCVNAATDPTHCGACDHSCQSSQTCVAGQCQ